MLNKRLPPLVTFLISFSLLAYAYYSTFFLDELLDSLEIHRIVQIGLLLFISLQISNNITRHLTESFLKSKWVNMTKLTPLAIFLLFTLIISLAFDYIRKSHFDQYAVSAKAIMIESQYFEFKHENQEYHGKIRESYGDCVEEYPNIGDSVRIKFSSRNPRINEVIGCH